MKDRGIAELEARGRFVEAQEKLINSAYGTDRNAILMAAEAFRLASTEWLRAKGAIS